MNSQTHPIRHWVHLNPLAAAEELLFPRRCPVCDRPAAPAGTLICAPCRAQLRRIEGPVCMKCGKPVRPGAEYCYDCRRIHHRFRYGCAAYPYRSISGAVYRFKFEGRAEYADWFGQEMAACIREHFDPGRIDLLVPVPSSARRVRERGYNQAALLGRVIARETGIPERQDLLMRTENTPYLRGLDASARRERLKNAFLVYGNDVESKCIMLIDDIYTTGSTIDACAGQLLRAGAAAVLFCTLAIGESDRE